MEEFGGDSIYKASFELTLDSVKVFTQTLRVRKEMRELASRRQELELERKAEMVEKPR